jgi:hypothetical protein
LIRFPAANEREVFISIVRMSAAYRLLHCFEVRLCEVISHLMESKVGPDWIRSRVSPNIVALWKEKRVKAEQKGFIASDLCSNMPTSQSTLGSSCSATTGARCFSQYSETNKDTEVLV